MGKERLEMWHQSCQNPGWSEIGESNVNLQFKAQGLVKDNWKIKIKICGINLIDYIASDGPMIEHLKWAMNYYFVKDSIINNRKRHIESTCLCENIGDLCRSPPYSQHCKILCNTISANLNDIPELWWNIIIIQTTLTMLGNVDKAVLCIYLPLHTYWFF